MDVARHRFALAAVLALFVALLVPSPAGAAHGPTFTVNAATDAVDGNLGDDKCEIVGAAAGTCTLRAAVMQANANPDANTILLSGVTYDLTLVCGGADTDACGDLDLTQPVTIDAPDSAPFAVVDANGIDRAIEIVCCGSGTPASPNVSLIDFDITGGSSAVAGGGLSATGDAYVLLSRMVVRNNVTVVTCGVACFGTSGGGIATDVAVMDIVQSSITSNSTSGAGVGNPPQGGGVLSLGTDLNVVGSTISGNFGGWGGGMAVHGTASVVDSEITNNTTFFLAGGIYAGGLVAGTLTIEGSTVNDNDTDDGGGGLYALQPVDIVNSTFSGNTVGNLSGGGILAANDADTAVTLSNVTVAGNTSKNPGGGLAYEGPDAQPFELATSIVADNSGAECAVVTPPTSGPAFVSLGNNVDSDNTCNLTEPTDKPGVDPLLGPLQDNGGPTPTMAIDQTSPAFDIGCSALCQTEDQRHLPRPSGATHDAGAFEFQVAAPPVTPVEPPPAATIDCEPETATNDRGTEHTITCTATTARGEAAADESVSFSSTGVGILTSSATGTTDAAGRVTATITSPTVGEQQVTATLGDTTACSQGGTCSDTVTKTWVEPRTVDCTNADAICGTDGDDVLTGTEGPDILIGGAGNDTIDCGGGSDFVLAGAGDDVVNCGSGDDHVEGGEGTDSLNGGEGGDQIFGDCGADLINGQDGNDDLFGECDGDTLIGELGDDTLLGGAARDVLFGDFEESRTGESRASWLSYPRIFDEGGSDSLFGQGGRDLSFGGARADLIRSGRGDDRSLGGIGRDEVVGEDGDDKLFGEDGDDVLKGGEGSDVLKAGLGDDFCLFGDLDKVVDSCEKKKRAHKRAH